ncbi:hypothetical protein JCM16303_003317 [Sporobolomyces ruberrimus]
MDNDSNEAATKPATITPKLAIDLRLRFLESLVARNSRTPTSSSSLARRVSHIEAQLKQALDAGGSTDAVRRFAQNYDLNSPLLSVAPLPIHQGHSNDLSFEAKVSLILEAETEITTLERELREIDILHQRGVVEVGKLSEHEALKEPLEQLVKDTKPISTTYASLEERTTVLLQRYNDYITDLSELFISWNDLLTEAEETVTKLEKQRDQTLDIS